MAVLVRMAWAEPHNGDDSAPGAHWVTVRQGGQRLSRLGGGQCRLILAKAGVERDGNAHEAARKLAAAVLDRFPPRAQSPMPTGLRTVSACI